MKWLFNKCGRYEADLSSLATGALPEAERATLQAHLANCAACRVKLTELQSLARGLSRLGRCLPEAEAPASLRRRWMTAVRASAAEHRGAVGTVQPTGGIVFGWLSGRRLAWGSVTAMWALVLFFRVSAPDAPKPASLASAPPVSLREVLLALKVEHSSPLLRADVSKPFHPKQTPPDVLPPRSQYPGARTTTYSEIT